MIFKPTPLDLGPLPTEQINKILGLNLAPAGVRFSGRAQQHAYEGHPKDFALCLRHIAQIVRKPDFVGQSPHHPEAFELIGITREEASIVLVAVDIRREAAEFYRVSSTYCIHHSTLQRRLRKGFITQTTN